MATFFGVLVCFCALDLLATIESTSISDVIHTDHWKEIESQSRHVRDIKRASCVITIPEAKADGLTKLLNELLSFFASKPELLGEDSSRNTSSLFVLNCDNTVSELETSVGLILNRVRLATSCQYTDEEYDEAIREVEDEGSKVLITLGNMGVRLLNDTIKTEYYQRTVTKVRVILEQTIKKMRQAQSMDQCDSSETENFRGVLREKKSQKNETTALLEETREALGATKALKEEMDKRFQLLITSEGALEEYKRSTQIVFAAHSKKIRELQAYKISTQRAIDGLSKKIRGLEEDKTNMSQLIQKQDQQIRDQAGLLKKLNAKVFPPSPALKAYLSTGFAGLSGRAVNLENAYYKGEFLYLARNPTDRNVSVYEDGAILAVGEERLRESAFLWEFVPLPEEGKSIFYLRNKLREQQPLASKEYKDDGKWNYISLEIVSSPEVAQPDQLLIYMREIVDRYYYYFPNTTPTTDSELNGRDTRRVSSHSEPGTEWIVHFAS